MVRIVIDAMGGDNAPDVVVDGAVSAINQGIVEPGEILLVGREEEVTSKIAEKGVTDIGIQIINATQVVEMNESPVDALRKKRDSSIVKSLGMLKKGKADAFISAGNTGAVVASSVFLLGMLEGIHRPGIGVLFSTSTGACTIIDVGANIHCKPIQLFQYGWMATNYMKHVMNIENPSIGMINIGEEDKKGTSLVRETSALLANSPLNFIGNIEGQDLFSGKCDVIVCDGFVGNVILKLSEGLGTYIKRALTEHLKNDSGNGETQGKAHWHGFLAGFLAKLDYAEYGAAPLLGVDGTVFIGHGRSDARAFGNAIKVARISAEQKVNEHITTGLDEL